MSSSKLWQLSAVELAEGIRSRELSATEVLDSTLARIDEHNPSINAIVYDCRKSAREEATKADNAIAKGETIGPLHGVPVTVKVNIDQTGTPTTNGSVAFKDLTAPEDSPVVAHLRRSGAIIVGRTNTPEFSMRATTYNPLHGRTLNPWNAEMTPGGSSGGAGAAAAAGFGPIHHGNDIGGSLRFPASACGAATVKPTLGRVAAFNPTFPGERGLLAQLMSVQGVICREVADVRLATRVLAQEDPRDPWWVPAPLDGFESEAKDVRVAFTTESYGYPLHPEVLGLLETCAGYLADAGFQVEETETPSMQEAAQGWFDVAAYEVQQTIGPLAQAHGSEELKRIFGWYYNLGALVDERGYRERIAARTTIAREWNVFLHEYPLVLTPFLMRPTFRWNYDAESEEAVRDLFYGSVYSCGVNWLGLPAGVLPGGLVEGLPCGVQVIGKRFHEMLILDALQAIESRVGILTHNLWEQGL